MEVLPRALLGATCCSVSQCSSVVRNVQAGRHASTPTRPLASFLASTSFLIASVPASLALSYGEFVKEVEDKAATSTTAPNSLYDADSFFFIDFDAATDFMTANPVAFLAGLAAVAVPLIAFTALASPQTFGSVSAAEAFAKLGEPNAQLLDIRAPEDVKADGTPNLKSLNKKAAQLPYTGDADAFVAKAVAKFKSPENTTLYILDRVDENSLTVAKLLANNGFEGTFAIKGGVDGPNGWKKNELPWLVPRKGFNFSLEGLKDILNGTDTSSVVPTTLGVAAAAGLGVAFFAEAESALQLLGSAAFLQIFVRKFMFAKDREKTINDVTTFLNTKVAPKDFADELKEVGRVLLPKDAQRAKAVASGEAVVEKELKVDSVTPEAVAGKVA